VLAECGFQDASYLDEFARGVLADRAKPAAPSGPASDRARAHYRRGELDLAEKALGEATTIDARRLRAAILARRRQGALALEELGLAKRIAPAELQPALAVDEARVRMRFEEARDGSRASSRRDRRRGRRGGGVLSGLRRPGYGVERGRTAGRLVENASASRWAWKAAAGSTAPGPCSRRTPRLPEEDPSRRAAPAPLFQRLRAPSARRSRLVLHQRRRSW
jgi:hypothetical protein